MSVDLISLNGKQALITGGGTGIGLAISRAFCEAGGHVILISGPEYLVQQRVRAALRC
jgi:gluconate 5-dehydrogenase